MALTKKKNQKTRKTKRNGFKNSLARSRRAYFFFDKGLRYWDNGNLTKALSCILKAVQEKPPEVGDILRALVDLGGEMDRPDIILMGYGGLHKLEEIDNSAYPQYINLLLNEGKAETALPVLEKYRQILSRTALPNKEKQKMLKQTDEITQHCRNLIARNNYLRNTRKSLLKENRNEPVAPAEEPSISSRTDDGDFVEEAVVSVGDRQAVAIPLTLTVDTSSFEQPLTKAETVGREALEVTLAAHRISFRNSFENLLCLPLLHNVESFWYQEETVRKVLKTFRGRAMLADEVGLGKTVEAGMVLREYIERGMVRSALILTPTPLVSQWKEELRIKFDLDFVSTDDQGGRVGERVWEKPFVLASINKAKSKTNFSKVTAREYDMVIVDEAHHLKNRTTLNWKLVNSLQKRFLLLLTATPVENNLLELYNLITLLKPGLLSTASAFKQEYMLEQDMVSPAKRAMLRGLLDQVMIRNTRALAALNIPPRFAQTVRIEPQEYELRLYQTVTELVSAISRSGGRPHRILLKNLLAVAGSSPRALSNTLRNLMKKDGDSLEDFRERIAALSNMCRSMTGETGKNKALVKLVRKTGGKKIVFVKFLGSMEEIADYLEWHGISFAVFHGSLTNREKDEAIEEFRKEKDVLVTTEIGGEGRNLQFCHQMINYDLPWNPMKIEQRIGRIHRIGQQHEVMIYNFCGKGSVEEYILEILDRKINMFEMVIGEIDMILGRIRGEKDFEDMVYDIWVTAASEEERDKEFAKLGTTMKRSKTQYDKTRELDEQLFGEDYEL